MSLCNEIARLLEDLADAKTWPDKFREDITRGAKSDIEIVTADKKIERLEKHARQLIRRLGCTDPKTRLLFQGMADMLINWYAFKDEGMP
jgi:hypothetical protein